MKYQVIFPQKSLKHLRKIDTTWQRKIIHYIENHLAIDPTIGEPLKHELKGYWKLRIANYRVVYFVAHKTITIYIVDIRHRKDIYRKF